MFLFSTEAEASGIEKIGGTILGVLRSFLIVGLVLIVLLLVPVKFVESSVKNSFLGSFIVSSDVKAYTIVARVGLRSEEISYKEEISELFGKKEGYLLEPVDVKEKSRFFREQY